MRQVKLYIATSLDGKIARKNGAIDWLPDPTEEDYGYQVLYDSIDTVLMGYTTYQQCLEYGEWYYKDKVTYVFSRYSDKGGISEVNLVNTDPVEQVRALKQMDGKDIWLVGGGQLIAPLHDAGLIDEYILALVPIILGEGIELFPAIKNEQKLILNKQKVYSNGLLMMYLTKEGSTSA